MNGLEERYAVVSYPDNRVLVRWLRPLEAAAYVETYNRLVRDPLRRAQIVSEPVDNAPAETRRRSKSV